MSNKFRIARIVKTLVLAVLPSEFHILSFILGIQKRISHKKTEKATQKRDKTGTRDGKRCVKTKPIKVDHESSQAFELLRIDQGMGSTSGIRACALRNFDLEVMELENTQNNALAKLPILKLEEYRMWEIRIKQYFQIQDYAL
ncbi:hypothetical protein Tco_1022011 [Tanacetum coccineum]